MSNKRVQLDPAHLAEPENSPSVPSTPSAATASGFASSPSSRSFSAGTPNVRATRVDEVNTLRELNKRLEYYILCQKAREATAANSRAEAASIREKARNDFTELRNVYERRLNQDTEARDRLRDELAQTQAETARLQRELAQLRARLEIADAEKLQIAETAQQHLANYNEAKAKAIELESEVDRITTALQNAEEDAMAKGAELENARRDALARQKALQAKLSELDKVCATKDAKLKLATSDIEALRKQYDELAETAKNMEPKLMMRFNEHLDREVQRLQQDHENKLRETLKEVKRDYDQSTEDLVAQIDALKAERDDAKRAATQSAAENRELRLQNRDLHTQVEAAKVREGSVLEELERAHAEHKSELTHLQTRLEQVDARAREQSAFMSLLIDARVTLEEEIEEYRKMIEAEGRRTGRNFFMKSGDASVPDFSRMESVRRGSVDDSTYAVLITEIDVNGSYIKIKNGTASPVPLAGWRIRSAKTRKHFEFPSGLVMEPRQVLTIHIGKDAKSKVKSENDLAWVVERAFAIEGDTAILTDHVNTHVSKVDVVAE